MDSDAAQPSKVLDVMAAGGQGPTTVGLSRREGQRGKGVVSEKSAQLALFEESWRGDLQSRKSELSKEERIPERAIGRGRPSYFDENESS